MTGPTSCGTCNTLGLAILPVRYTVVPAALKPALPDGISGKRVKDVALDTQQYQYALRTLRYGYVYLFYAKGPRGKNYWDAYSVSSYGDLIKQPVAPAVCPSSDIPCRAPGHISERPSYFCIEQPDKCGTVWIAFSEHIWSDETINEYATNASLRGKRMQAIEPAAWINSPKHEHATEATPASLEKVLEYRPGLALSELTRDNLSAISNVNGSYAADKLATQTSRYPAHLRNDPKTATSKQTIQLMHKSGKRPDGKSTPPMLLALWDSIGITHELNGYRNEAAGRIKQYGDERELEITALAAIEGAKKALEDKAEANVNSKANQADAINKRIYSASDLAYRRANAATLPEPQRGYRLEDINLMEQWQAQSVPWQTTQRLDQIQASTYNRNLRWQDPQARPSLDAMRNKQRDPIINEANAYLNTRDPNKKAAIAQARTDTWPKYEKKLNLDAYTTFKTNYDKFQEDADKLIDARTEQLLLWLKAELFLDTLEDYHETNLRDGFAFENVIGDAIFGITSSPNGEKFITGWSQQDKAERTNLLWRALASNQKQGKEALNAILAAAIQGEATPLTETTGAAIAGVSAPLAILATQTKNSLSLWNANHNQSIKKTNPRGLDKIFMTVGEILFAKKGIAQKFDSVGTAIMRGTILVRSGATHAKVMSLLLTEAKHAVKAREEIKLLLALGTAIADKEASKMRQELTQKWKDLLSTDNLQKPSGAFNEALDMRFGIVTTLLQAVFVSSLMAENSSDPKIQADLLAAKFSLGAGVVDLLATGLKGAAGEAALTFQGLKVAGGLLSGVAAWVTVVWSANTAVDDWGRGRYGLSLLYGAKSAADLFAGAAFFVATLSYAEPALKMLATRYPGSQLALALKAIGTNLLRRRAWLLLWGMRLNLLSLAISAAIWIFSDDELQDWCEQCAFSKNGPEDRYKTAVLQMRKFKLALESVN